MKAKKQYKPTETGSDIIRLQVDRKTIILVRNKKALSMWMERYPNARVIAA
ncbi:MAG: hypothetical protein FD123_2214 [Bacteroidetes bacterium]|nr:MAG: hypothetical protein FD123_2214 [Bacteroidota bacterium]